MCLLMRNGSVAIPQGKWRKGRSNTDIGNKTGIILGVQNVEYISAMQTERAIVFLKNIALTAVQKWTRRSKSMSNSYHG